MTDTTSPSTLAVDEALELIDRSLRQVLSRELMSASEVADLLLDLRVLLTTADTELLAEPVGAIG